MNHPNNNEAPAKARRDDLVIQEMPDEVLVYDLKTHKAHCLNETAAFVWNHCDGRLTASQIAVLIEKKWGEPVVEDVVWLAIKQLSRANLLQDIGVTNGAKRTSRRAVLRKLGAAAAMTPLVVSILAPTASAGASIPPACQSCVKKSNGIQDCPSVCTSVVSGTCYGNSGCGNGQKKPGCVSCQACFSTGEATVSWVAPGDNSC